ncbi:MAG: hypothetical protein PHP01_02275 [Phycisphaerae bacterium]|nr:hypothetical protein [Phycisphaerae bacterium]
MSTMLLSTKLSWVLIVLFMLNVFILPGTAEDNQQCQWVPVSQDNFAEILTMINSRIEKNYNKIKTWQGKVTTVYDSVINEGDGRRKLYEKIVDKALPNKIIDHVELTREFVVDVNKEFLYDSIYPDAQQEIIDDQAGEKLPLKKYVQIASGKNVLTPNYQLNCRDIKNQDGVVIRHDVIKQLRSPGGTTCQDNLNTVFDPMETMRVFGDITGKSSAPLGGTFAKYLAFFNEKGGHNIDGHSTITIEECNVGDIKKYRITLLILSKDDSGSTVYVSSILTCSSERDFNIDSFLATYNNGKMVESKTWDYGLIGGIFLPKRKTQQKFDYHTGDLTNQSTISFIDQKVNNSISNEVFTYKNLGLKNGDKFIDKAENKEYHYKEATKTLELINKD